MHYLAYCPLESARPPPDHLAMVKARKAARRPTFIREWRKFRDVSQEELAEIAGMSPGNLSQIETGRISYTADTLQRIATALDCTRGDLLDVNPFELDDLDRLARNNLTPEQRQTVADLAGVVLKGAK